VLTWQLHWVAGWDPTTSEYRATLADNYGHADVMRGWIDGNRLTSKPSATRRFGCASSGTEATQPR
jgi:hypothetical protein